MDLYNVEMPLCGGIYDNWAVGDSLPPTPLLGKATVYYVHAYGWASHALVKRTTNLIVNLSVNVFYICLQNEGQYSGVE